MTFVHLHNHTEFSLLDGAARIKNMVARAKELNMPAIAITDHGVMYGTIHFYQAAKDAGIKPIIGCEVYVAKRSRHDKDGRKDDSSYHLVLLAESQKGYENLCRLVSIGFLEGFYYKPRVDREILAQYSEGLIALSGCIAGQLSQLFLEGRDDEARALALDYQSIFGRDNYYIEIQNHGIQDELAVLPKLIALAKELAIPLVATNDLHYVEQNDAKIHDILLCIQTGHTRDEENRMRFPGDDFYLKTEEEMTALFGQWPEALSNTAAIAERCQVEFSFGELYLPDYEVPEGYDLHSYLIHLCQDGMKRRYPNADQVVFDRLEFELDIIKKMGFSGYFLIVWDMINYARSQSISVGPGRGSAAGSIVAYVLGITDIDPIAYDLLFERFLNPERVSPPDIDVDICDERRGEVVDYLFKKYGYDKVSQIITFNFLLAKGAVRDVGRVLGMPYADVDIVSKLIPNEPKFSLSDIKDRAPELYQLYQSDPNVHELIDIAAKIEGVPRHAGKHAAGVVIAKQELISYMPVQRLADGIVTTQFEKQQVEDCGLLKMDLLGLRTLSVIENALENIKISKDLNIDISQIPLDDPLTFDMLCRGDSVCVFQLESSGMRNILRNLRPERFEDIIALVALYRPGPLGSGMVEQFISNKHGETEITYMHPLLEKILQETYGVILYQEQVMQIASTLAGFSLGQSDMLRRAMGKKKPEIIAKERTHFVSGCVENKIDIKVAGEIFDLMEYFAGYGFNKSHSAAYALVSYQTAWLKANYPEEFMASMMTSVMDTADKVPEYIDECKRMGILVLPPDINESYVKFAVVGGKIRFALSAVKNVGREAVKRIVEERNAHGPYASMTDLCRRLPVNRKILESLVKCGAFDSLGVYRSRLLQAVDRALEIGKKVVQDKDSMQMSLFDFGIEDNQLNDDTEDFSNLPEYNAAELLAMEKEMIGFYVSGHPLDGYVPFFEKKNCLNTIALQEEESGSMINVGGQIGGLRTLLTKKGDSMAIFSLEDKYSAVKCIVFPRNYSELHSLILPDKVVIAEGKLQINEEQREIIVVNIKSAFKLYLRLPDSKGQIFIDKIKEFLLLYPGDGPVSVYYEDMKQYYDLPGVKGVAPDRVMLEHLQEWLGQANVVLK